MKSCPFGDPPGKIKFAFSACYDDVKQVFCDEDHFSVRLYAQAIGRITFGQNMIIGMPKDDPERILRLQIWADAVKLPDPIVTATIVQEAMQEILARFGPAGRLDVVADVARIVPLVLASYYYGIPGPDWFSPTVAAAYFTQVKFVAGFLPTGWRRFPNSSRATSRLLHCKGGLDLPSCRSS